MDADDPEKRIAELEHQLAAQKRGTDLPPAQPPRLANALWGKGSGRRSSLNVFAAVGAAVFALVGLWYGVNDFRGYSHGTPTTATINRCGGKGSRCEGTWSIDGVSHAGLIERGFSTPPVGSTMDVPVSDGRAYLAGSWLPSFTLGVFSSLRRSARSLAGAVGPAAVSRAAPRPGSVAG